MNNDKWMGRSRRPKALCQAGLLAACLMLLAAGTSAFAQPHSCIGHGSNDFGEQLPASMWSGVEYKVNISAKGEGSREAICARHGSFVKRGAPFQWGMSFCYAGCNPVNVWEDGPQYYCETRHLPDLYTYEPIFLQATSRCSETTAQLTGPKQIPDDLAGTEHGVDMKIRLSDHARYFTPAEFHIDMPRLTVTSDSPGPDNRLSDHKFGYLSLPPLAGGLYRVDESGEFSFKFLPHNYFLSRPVKRQTLTVKAGCNWCKDTASWRIRVGSPDIVIGFFNGVANTRRAAESSLYRLEVEFGPVHKDAPIKYDWFYNQTACGEGALGKLSCLEDVAEVFEQRSRELGGVFANRWESFWDILAGRHQQDTSFTGRLTGLLGDGGTALLMWVDGAASAMLNQLTSGFLKLLTLFIDSPTYDNQASHLERLMRYADEGSGLLLVAHSQGNLFVNSAVDALKAAKPDAQVQVVHVAPASPTLRGDHVLTDIDLVINGLRLTGFNSVPDVNIHLPLSKLDPSGHSFEPTYLDKARAAYARTRSHIVQSLNALAN